MNHFYSMLLANAQESKYRYNDKRPIWLLFLIEWLEESELRSWYIRLIGQHICKRFGHKLTSESWCNPDAGGEHFDCSRCGWSQTIHYY